MRVCLREIADIVERVPVEDGIPEVVIDLAPNEQVVGFEIAPVAGVRNEARHWRWTATIATYPNNHQEDR